MRHGTCGLSAVRSHLPVIKRARGRLVCKGPLLLSPLVLGPWALSEIPLPFMSARGEGQAV